MRKIVLLLAALLAVCGAEAQNWSLGVRMGTGLVAIGQRSITDNTALEARLGIGWAYPPATIEASLLHVWRTAEMNWTSRGEWWFDVGAGGYLATADRFLACGVQGMARLGYRIENSPLALALDWSPSFGPQIEYRTETKTSSGTVVKRSSTSAFNERGLANFGLALIYTF